MPMKKTRRKLKNDTDDNLLQLKQINGHVDKCPVPKDGLVSLQTEV